MVSSMDPAAGESAWTATLVDPTRQLDGLSCPSASLCVGVDPYGNVVSSTDPLGGAGAWKVASVDSAQQFFGAIACPSTTLCVAVDNFGAAVTSTNPAGGAGAWTSPVSIDPSGAGTLSLACPSVSLCVAGGIGDVTVSTDPTGGSRAWRTFKLSQTYAISNVSCPSTTLCVAIDESGHVLTSTDPTGGASAWTAEPLDDPHEIDALSCPSEGLCVVGDNAGNVLVSTNPAGGAATWSGPVDVDPGHGLYALSCSSGSFCVAGDGSGNVATSTNPTGGASAWAVTPALTGANALGPMSCASASLCVAFDDAGRLLSSTTPGSPQPVWNVPATASLPDSSQFELSCPSSSLCVAAASHNKPAGCHPCGFPFETVITSTDPAEGPTAWRDSTPAGMDILGPPVFGLSCASSRLCVAIQGGSVLTSAQPTSAKAWTGPTNVSQNQLSDISCNARLLCVATDYRGNVTTSNAPTGGTTEWNTAYVDRALPIGVGSLGTQAALYGVSCASELMCATVDSGGNVLTATDPTGGAGAWTTHHLNLGYFLTQIACPSISLCVAIGAGGDVVTSTDPTGPSSSWKVTTIDPGVALTSLSCPSARLCLAADQNGNVIAGTGPGPKGVTRRNALAALAGALRRSCTRQQIATIDRRGRCRTPFAAPGPGQITITWLGEQRQILATGQLVTTARHRVDIDVLLTTAGKRLLHGASHVRVRIKAAFLDAAGHLYGKTIRTTLIRRRTSRPGRPPA